jgi:uncharacterized protein YbaR (Trm112 family)
MFIELVDFLRCLSPHEDTWLVAAVMRMDGRHIVEGTLGCPVCRRAYPIANGVAWFTDREPGGADLERLTTAGPAVDEQITRAAALLGLTEPGGLIVLGGSWARFADAAAELGAAHVVVLNAQASESSPQEVSALVVETKLPFSSGSLRAAALGSELAAPRLLTAAAQALRSRGRLVAPAHAPVPENVEVLARDDTDWVAERTVVASPPVTLRPSRR